MSTTPVEGHLLNTNLAVVLAGGGARGAYEAGVLSILLPALEAQGRRPDVYLGTSAGAINAVGFASLHHLGAAASSEAVLDLWREVDAGSVFRPPVRTILGKLAGLGRGRRRGGALLDTEPLAPTLERLVDWNCLHANVRDGCIAAVGVVATSSSTRDSTVFLETAPGLTCPPPDRIRGITYVRAQLGPRYVLASSAIPVLFPAVEIDHPTAPGWYFDGGVRLNTPIKPAMALKAQRVVVVATSPADPPVGTPHISMSRPPGLAGAAAQLLYAMLDDRMVEDLRSLAHKNEPTVQGQVIPWLFGGPRSVDGGLLGRLVCEVLGGKRLGHRRRGPVSMLARRAIGRALAADPNRAELASHIFFDGEFIEGAIQLGRRDATRSLGPDGAPVWQEPGDGGTPDS